jgi:hypothetical protein
MKNSFSKLILYFSLVLSVSFPQALLQACDDYLETWFSEKPHIVDSEGENQAILLDLLNQIMLFVILDPSSGRAVKTLLFLFGLLQKEDLPSLMV